MSEKNINKEIKDKASYLQISDACATTQVQCHNVATVLSKHSAKKKENVQTHCFVN